MASLSPRERRSAHKARSDTQVDMNLVSLIDVFTILIFFLLSSATGVETLVSPKAVKLPEARVEQAPKDSVVVVVNGDEIYADGRTLLDKAGVTAAMAESSDTLPALKAELERLAARVAVRPENQGSAQAVTIMGDKDIPYRLLRKVMSTCAQAGYTDVQFAVRKREGA